MIKTLFWLTIFLIGVISTSAAKTKYVKYNKIECNGKPEFMSNVVCNINEISQYNNSADLSAKLVKPLEKLEIHVKMYKLPNVEKPFIVDYEFNGCEVLSGEKSHVFMDTFGELIKQHTNLNHPCPFKDEVYARGMNIYNIPFWPNAPLGSYRIDLNTFEEKDVSIGEIKLFFEIGEY